MHYSSGLRYDKDISISCEQRKIQKTMILASKAIAGKHSILCNVAFIISTLCYVD